MRNQPAAGVEAVADGAGAAGADEEALSAAAEVAPALPPPRKSVTYQPDPLSWNPAAVTCLA